MTKIDLQPAKYSFDVYTAIICVLTFSVPLLVLPMVIDNAFNTPKNALLIIGTSIMLGIYGIRFFQGKATPVPNSPTPVVLVFLILLNFFSFFYTGNYYYTTVAAALNIACLIIFYFLSISINRSRALIVLYIAAFSGFLVSLVTWLQFFGIFIVFKWAHKGINVMGTIGNSNYLGAYLVFPLFCMVTLIFLVRGKWRLVPLGLFIFMVFAFLFSRARAGWMGFFLSLPLFLFLVKKIHRFSVLDYVGANKNRVITAGAVIIVILVGLWFAAPERLHRMMRLKQVTQSDTLMLRMNKYYHASWWLFKQSPLFGTGLWSYRNMVYKAQAEINQKNPGFFEDYPEPKPRRVHTDYLEILNDGGLVAAAILLLFFLVVMRHGWMVIRNDELDNRDRIIAAGAFSSLSAIMLANFFFFPFRINSTMFMTVIMMGILEGLYLRNHDFITIRTGKRSDTRFTLIPCVILILIGVIWYTGIKPFKGEMEHFKYKRALNQKKPKQAETHIRKAIKYDPHNSAYCLYACQLYMNVLRDFGKANDFIERAILDYNGDLTYWSLYYIKGLLKFQMGSLFEARSAFQKALYYNPEFQPASKKLKEVNAVIKKHDKVLIKYR